MKANIISHILLLLLLPLLASAQFEKLAGDDGNNRPEKIKAFGDGVYVAGTRQSMGIRNATFSKFDPATGDLVWTILLMDSSTLFDFEHVPASDEFLLVGATEPTQVGGVPQDNESILIKVNDNGALVFARRYQQTGREGFTRIIRHPNPKNAAFPFYVLGAKNVPGSPAPPSTVDRVVLLNINELGTVNWSYEYDYPAAPDDEFYRVMFPVNSPGGMGGDVVIAGNDSPTGNGILVKIDGGTGAVLASLKYEGVIDINDGVEMSPGGTIAITGSDFGNGKAFVEVLNPNFASLNGLRFEDIGEFREIGMDAMNLLYVCGHTTAAPNYPVVFQLFNGAALNATQAAYLDWGEMAFANCRLSVTPSANRLFYADGRINTTYGLGNYDLLVGNYDLSLSSACNTPFSINTTLFSLINTPIAVNVQPFTLPNPGVVHDGPVDYQTVDFCPVPCEAAFIISSQGCHFDFASISTGASLDYCWDASWMSGTCDYTSMNFSQDFPGCGTHTLCLTITAADGCTDTECKTFTVTEGILPVFTNCPSAITAPTDPGTCTAFLDPLITFTDYCDPNPLIACTLTGATTGTATTGFYNKGVTTVTCTVTDNCGNTSLPCTFTVTVDDLEKPQVSCLNLVFVGTDDGECTGKYMPEVDATDNCDPNPLITNCTFTQGGITLNGTMAELGLGAWDITCTVADFCGNTEECSSTALVVDDEKPTIQCPPSQTINVLGCSDGSEANFDQPTVNDNCPGVTYACSPAYLSGDFFPCGTTTITCTATDGAGQTANCSFSIMVNGCGSCAQFIGSEIQCTGVEGVYEFTASFQDLTGLTFASATATIDAFAPATVSANWFPGITTGTFLGTITSPCPLPLQLQMEVTFSFPCTLGVITCTIPVTLATPCCASVSVADQLVCKNEATAVVPLVGTSCLLPDVLQTTWYVSPQPCTTWAVYQVSSGWQDLVLLPGSLPGDVCVYAEVFLANNPCQPALVSNIAQIKLCDLPQGAISNGSQQYCSDAVPSPVPDLVFANSDPACLYSIQWYDHTGILTGETNDTYAPGSLFYNDPAAAFTNDCYTEYRFTATVTNDCGTSDFTATIRIDNFNAPLGDLILLPPDVPPLCPGEDAVLHYEVACADPEEWTWCKKTLSVPIYAEIVGAGTTNADYYTNQLEEDTWFKVKKFNGACPVGETEFFIDVQGPFLLTDFSAMEDDTCNPSGVLMTVDVNTDCNSFNVEWYKDGNLIALTTHTSSPVSLPYATPPLDGNYYVIVEDNCCHRRIKSEVVVHDVPFSFFVTGPCFRCNDEDALLQGMFFDVPSWATCTYQWYKDGLLLPGETGIFLLIDDTDAVYTLEATCGGCTKTADFSLLQCGDPTGIISINGQDIGVSVFPNPTSGHLQIAFDNALGTEFLLRVLDIRGSVVSSQIIPPGEMQHSVAFDRLPPAVYWLELSDESGNAWRQKVVKQ